jgi:hypothetical protein
MQKKNGRGGKEEKENRKRVGGGGERENSKRFGDRERVDGVEREAGVRGKEN